MISIMALSTQPYKGARDFYPEDKRIQKYVFNVMRQVAEKFGYEEYDAPLLEPLELFAAKTGEEIVNEQTYTFTDRGGRKVAIRPEMTPSVSRMVAARRQELAYPLRWYSIPSNWRYERPQRGRSREFWQLNIDLFGIEGIEAEQEVITLADAVMQAYGAKRSQYTIKLNSRKLINACLEEYLKLSDLQTREMIKLIDRMPKMAEGEFKPQAEAILKPSQIKDGSLKKLLELVKADDIKDLPEEIYKHSSVTELKKLINLLEANGIKNVEYDFSVMRGLDYYTDIVFEVVDNDPENNRAMFGGGRYDGLVGMFGVEPLPTVGFGMGDVTLQNFLESHQLMPKLQTETDVYSVIVGDVFEESQKVIGELRDNGLNVAVDMSGRKPAAQIKSAVKKGIAYCVFIGKDDLRKQRFNLKDLDTGDEKSLSLTKIIDLIAKYRDSK